MGGRTDGADGQSGAEKDKDREIDRRTDERSTDRRLVSLSIVGFDES